MGLVLFILLFTVRSQAIDTQKGCRLFRGHSLSDRASLIGCCSHSKMHFRDPCRGGKFAASEAEYRRGLALVEKNEGQASLDYAVLLAGMPFF